MKQTIEIEVPDGKEVVYDEYTKSIKFIDKKPIISKSWEEFVNNHPNISNEWFIENNTGLYQVSCDETIVNRDKNEDRNLLATKQDAEGILALIQLTRLRDEWVGDWTPDYRNFNEDKYHINVRNDNITVDRYSYTRALLSFPTNTLATEFMQCFKDLIIKAKRFI